MVEGTAWVSEEFPAQDLALWTTPLQELAVAAQTARA